MMGKNYWEGFTLGAPRTARLRSLQLRLSYPVEVGLRRFCL